ncbi:leucine-rich repeat domain-containing protein, partial [Blautia wexlerae]|uniref:leucine-rich repeat domain-containing protein n=3 Tax=Lachnospiraceae TaxID=186803 RepID=UPI00325B3FA2
MNRKCKKTGIFIGLTMAITGMTACGETEPEETPVVKEETAKPTETPAPTSTPTPTPTPIPEYIDYDYEEAGVTIQIPGMLWDIKPEKTDSGLIFTDPDEKWLIRFYPLTYDRKIRVYDNLTNVFGEDGSKVKDKNLSSVSIEEGDYGNSGYKYKRYTWALDVEKASAYESFITAYPHIVEIINYDQTAIEGYNAILVEVTTPEGLDEAGSLDREQFYAYTSLKESLSRDIQDQTATREKYPDVSDIDTKETRRFVENLTFAEGGSTIAASIDGVELEIPAFWEIIPTSAEQHLLVSFNRGTEEKGSLAIHPATMNGYDPVYNALLGCGRGAGVDRDDQEEIQARFKAAEADGLVKEFKAGKTVFYGAYSPVSHKLSFNTLFTKEHCLCIELYFLKELSKEELWDYAQGENFQTVLNSIKIDVNIPTEEEIQIDRSFDISNDGVLKKYKGTDPEVIISDVIKGIEVKEIGEYAFYNCADVKKVVISSAVERIDKGAFANCAALEEVTLPSTLKYLGDYAFEDCSSLTKVELPDGLEKVGVESFSKTSIEKLTVPGSMKVIGTNVFGDMMNLHEIHIEEGVEEIEERAFQGAGSR